MKRYGVDRISINPQTLNDGVLELIGRKHSARQTIDAFKLARKEGFHHINMDLIAGLPGDSLTSFSEHNTRYLPVGSGKCYNPYLSNEKIL